MKNRKEFIERLHADPKYQEALAAARTDAERQQVAGMVEAFVGSFADILGPLIERAESDPIFAEQLGRSLIEQRDVVSTSDPATSGSTG